MPSNTKFPKKQRRQREYGVAEIRIRLENGEMTVRHRDGTILHKKKAFNGDWDKIWKAILLP